MPEDGSKFYDIHLELIRKLHAFFIKIYILISQVFIYDEGRQY